MKRKLIIELVSIIISFIVIAIPFFVGRYITNYDSGGIILTTLLFYDTMFTHRHISRWLKETFDNGINK